MLGRRGLPQPSPPLAAPCDTLSTYPGCVEGKGRRANLKNDLLPCTAQVCHFTAGASTVRASVCPLPGQARPRRIAVTSSLGVGPVGSACRQASHRLASITERLSSFGRYAGRNLVTYLGRDQIGGRERELRKKNKWTTRLCSPPSPRAAAWRSPLTGAGGVWSF